MKRTKIAVAFAAASLLVLLSASFANAALNISVTVKYPQIAQGQSQIITATTNEGGKGILLVLQPAEGDPWAGFLQDHPDLEDLWNSLPSDTQSQVKDAVGNKIVSYKIIVTDQAGSEDVAFPDDFKGINGEPSTALVGTYTVIFVFVGAPADGADATNANAEVSICKLDFDAVTASWFVVPEVPLGTIAAISSALVALSVFKLYKRKHA
jgi:hypothetical protein